MTQKKSYSRYFIILQEDEKGYALASDKLPSGYAKLEIKNDKCKVSYYVQNLKKESAPYYMILICGKKDVKKIIKLGELNIDDHGRADISHEYLAENVANCGINVDKVIGAAIVKFMNANVISVMSGFASTDIPDWKGFAVVEEEMKRNEPEEVQETPKEVQEVEAEAAKPNERAEVEAESEDVKPANIFEDYEKKIDEVKTRTEVEEETKETTEENSDDISRNEAEAEPVDEEVDDEDNSEESRHKKKKCKKGACEIKTEECEDKKHEKHKEEKCEKEEHEHKEEKCEKEESNKHKEEKCEKHKEDECDDEKHHKPMEYYFDEDVLKDYYKKPKKVYPKGYAGNFFMQVAQGFEELEGICGEIKRCTWYKVPVSAPEDMTGCLDYNKYNVAYYPMMNYYPYIKKFEHFVLGYKCDKDNKMKYLVYGIPGTKSRIDQPFAGRTGFVTWVPLREGEEDEGSYGYWLMFYDFRNSTIVIPVK